MQLEHFEISLILYQLNTRVEDFEVLFWKILSYEEKSILTNTAHRRLGPYTVQLPFHVMDISTVSQSDYNVYGE